LATGSPGEIKSRVSASSLEEAFIAEKLSSIFDKLRKMAENSLALSV
jgi:hypothetical protein